MGWLLEMCRLRESCREYDYYSFLGFVAGYENLVYDRTELIGHNLYHFITMTNINFPLTIGSGKEVY
jgi:hypothetical protein